MLRVLLAAVAAFVVSAAPVRAQPFIVDLAFVKAAVARGALLWDARDEPTFARGHIPGAVNIGLPTSELRDDNSEDYLPLAQLEKILGAAGIDPQREVVVYAQRGASNAYFAQLTLRYFGARKAYVYHDGIDGWRAAGEPVATAAAAPTPVALKLEPDASMIVDTRAVIAAVGRADVQFVDVRSPKEFRGEDLRALRGGHIPGAVNIPYEQNWVDPETMAKMRRGQLKDLSGATLKSREELRKLYAALDPDKETIVYCQSGNRAAETATVLADLGFRNVKVYDTSWLGYAAAAGAPVSDESLFNVGSLNAQLRAIEGRLNAIEKKLESEGGGKR